MERAFRQLPDEAVVSKGKIVSLTCHRSALYIVCENYRLDRRNTSAITPRAIGSSY
jgi:hypothetical protein